MSSLAEQQKKNASQAEQVESDLASVGLELKNVAAKIDAVENDIKALDVELARVTTEIKNSAEESKAELREEKAQLRTDKAQLLSKETQLQSKETQLLSKETQLLSVKAQLLSVKAQLLQKETRLSAMVVSPTTQFGSLKIGSGSGGGKTAPLLFLSTPVNQGSASSFVGKSMKRTVRGFGHLPSSCRVDPTADQRVSRRLIPSPQEEADEALVLACMGEKATLAARGEDETFGVRRVLGEIFGAFPPLVSSGSTMGSYSSHGAGISTNASKPDFVWMVKGRVVGILEAKGGAASTIVALRQAAITAMAIVSDLRSLNLPPEQIVIPVAGCTGSMMQFGAVICLDDSFGTFLATSAMLDLSVMAQNRLAAAYLRKASVCARETEQALTALTQEYSPQYPICAMNLDPNKYWIKFLTNEVFSRGLGLFTSDDVNRLDVGPGLEHMGRALTLLYEHNAAREFVVFPLSVRSPNQLDPLEPESETSNCYLIVYEDLTKLGYQMGTPNRLADEGLYQNFLVSLRLAVGEIHAAGVLHCDLYASNIMWRSGDGASTSAVSVKIIDWDCAHCLAEGAFCPRIAEALANHTPTRSAKFSVEHDLGYIAVLEQSRADGGPDELWEALASTKKSVVDNAFYKLFTLFFDRV